ncbi:MAG TPA: GGDEF domain-containing protein [Gaiellaceae bacterium]|nr:GGDEF domain-containing protein [Gaiellaceae bacterium]
MLPRPTSPLELGLRLRLMLTLAAVAIFPIAFVSYVIVRDEVRNVTRSIDFEVHNAALSAQARFAQLLNGRELHALAAASSPRLQAAIGNRDAKSLERFARTNDLLLEIGGQRYGQRLDHAVTGRVQLLSGGKAIGSIVAQLPLDPATLRDVSASAAKDVRFAFVGPGSGARTTPGGRGLTLPLASQIGVRAYVPGHVESHRKNAAYVRVAEAGLLALAALMLLTLLLARPLLRAFRWTEEQASEARVDSLTGLANRRALEEVLAAEISRAQRFAHQLAVVLLDLDRFKEINDSFGHAAGDVMLRAVSRLLIGLARQGDTVARWGGEEFVVVLPETDLAGAQRFAERLRRAIEAQSVGDMQTSASCGVATMLPEDNVEELLRAADQALYRAKSNGRNRTESAIRGPRPAAA